jgi:hypothetical protein
LIIKLGAAEAKLTSLSNLSEVRAVVFAQEILKHILEVFSSFFLCTF